MGGFITSTSSINRHGAYAIDATTASVIQATGTGKCAMVGQFPWGPTGSVFIPETPKDMIQTLAPAGATRTGSGYLSIIRKAFPEIAIVRVVGSAAAAATATVVATGPVNILTLTLNSVGAQGNSVIATVSAATDGDSNHFNLTVSLTGASGTTTDSLQNLNYSGTGADSTPNFSGLTFLGSITKLASGIPVAGNYTFSGGNDGSATSGNYVGTAGAGDAGLALFEAENDVRHVFCDDPGNSLRAAVNAGLQAHAELKGERVAYLNGNNALSSSATQTDAGNYRSVRVVYVDPWVYILDDVDGTQRAVPPAAFAASVAAQTSPSTSIAWKADETGKMLGGINALVTSRDASAGTNTNQGITTIIKEIDGSFRFEADVVTINASNPAKGSLRRTRVGDYIATSWSDSSRPLVDAPNVPLFQQPAVTALDKFLKRMKDAQNKDPAHTPFIVDYDIPITGANSQADIQSGVFNIPADVIVGASMAKLFLSLNFGETTTLSVQ